MEQFKHFTSHVPTRLLLDSLRTCVLQLDGISLVCFSLCIAANALEYTLTGTYYTHKNVSCEPYTCPRAYVLIKNRHLFLVYLYNVRDIN